MTTWITDWSEIGDQTEYLVRPINARQDRTLYLGRPTGILKGWEVKRLTPRCYAALEMPEWRGLPVKEAEPC